MDRLTHGFGMGAIVAAGVLGGLVFAVFEMVMAAVMMGPQAFFMPLRMISGIVLGEAALDPSYSLLLAGVVGVIVHMVLSIAFAAVLAAVVKSLDSAGTALAAGVAFGIALWIVNFYVLAPVMGWAWFPERSNAVVQFMAHAFFFGLPVAWYFTTQRSYIGRPVA